MKKQVGKHGFTLKEQREIPEIKATASLYEHEHSGARLLHMQCEDPNKLFCITFKTVPEDSTGCPHILEHSVLGGSRNFPGKSTFMELIKGSLHTFINAMTGPDATYYPVASTNAKDFYNLTRVYLDAVFFPKIYEQPNLLHQEGWHHELVSEDADLHIKGVVYNEMKGAFSSPDGIIYRRSQNTQFPDTPYGYVSGGDPQDIPNLTYEKFLAFHKKYYHPSNSYIFLYGDMDPEPLLELMDKDYLSQFERSTEAVDFPLQKPFGKVHRVDYQYPVEEGKDITGQFHVSFNYTYGNIKDRFTTEALGILDELLMHSPASPLKRAIMESGLAKDCWAGTSTDILQPTTFIVCKQVRLEDIPALEKLVHDTFTNLIAKGFDKKLIEGIINSKEFFLREGQMQGIPKGIFYSSTSLAPWIHGGDPLAALGFEDLLEELRRGLTEPYYEQLLEKALLKNKHASIVTYVPVPGLTAAQDASLRLRLNQLKEDMTPEQKKELVKFHSELLAWQAEEASVADLEKIPKLDISDINPLAAQYPYEKEKWGDVTLLKHPLTTNGIVYLKSYFDLAHAPETDLPWLSLYTYLAGKVDSQNYSYADLSNEIDIHTGGLSLTFNLKTDYQDPDLLFPKFIVSGKAVQAKVPNLTELLYEYALQPRFDDVARVKMLIREDKAKMEPHILRGGVTVAINRMFAPFSQYHHTSDLVTGLAYYHFLCDLEEKLDSDSVSIMHKLEQIRQTYFLKQKLILSITADEAAMQDAITNIKPLLAGLSSEEIEPVEEHYHTRDFNEGILAPVQIQFCAKGGNFFRKGYSYSGKMRVLNNILSNDLLNREIREKGGAYGAMSSFGMSGYMYFCSYMDPNLRESFEVYDRVADYLRSFDCSKREMEKYIIGEISSLDYPKTPEAQGMQADDDFITEFTQADRQQIRDEVLSTKVEDIRAYADMVEAIMGKNHICAFGNENKLKENGDLFDALTPVFK